MSINETIIVDCPVIPMFIPVFSNYLENYNVKKKKNNLFKARTRSELFSEKMLNLKIGTERLVKMLSTDGNEKKTLLRTQQSCSNIFHFRCTTSSN